MAQEVWVLKRTPGNDGFVVVPDSPFDQVVSRTRGEVLSSDVNDQAEVIEVTVTKHATLKRGVEVTVT